MKKRIEEYRERAAKGEMSIREAIFIIARSTRRAMKLVGGTITEVAEARDLFQLCADLAQYLRERVVI